MIRTAMTAALVLTLTGCPDFVPTDVSDTAVDTGCDNFIWYADVDGDGWGDDNVSEEACDQPDGYVEQGGDCNDAEASFHPSAVEEDCTDPNDYNCDGSVAFEDADLDGFAACADCNDADASVHPEAAEICNQVDDDCDGDVDDADDSLDASTTQTWYADGDADGFGRPEDSVSSCVPAEGYVAASTDCNDADAAVHPDATEICDGVDNNCDSSGDEGLTCTYRLETEDAEDGICVDDDVTVDVGETRVFTDVSAWASCHAPITFDATPGDTIDIHAYNSAGGCRSVSDVYIVNVQGGVRMLLAEGSSETGCSFPSSTTTPFWSVSTTIPGTF